MPNGYNLRAKPLDPLRSAEELTEMVLDSTEGKYQWHMRNHCTLDRPCEKAMMFRDVAVGLRKAAVYRHDSERARQAKAATQDRNRQPRAS